LIVNEIISGRAMIEYGLLFGLGFATALLAVLLLMPAVHRRIVKFTENRIMATVPVSTAELRAQKDMVRAEMATTVARTGHDLKQERQRAAQLSISNDQLSSEASRLSGDNADLRNEIEEMTVQASELRAGLRNDELWIDQLKETISGHERAGREKDAQIEMLQGRARQLGTEIDNLKIDLVTRDTEAEGLKARINALRDERESLRTDVHAVTQRAKEAELKLAREENRATRLEERLNAEVSGSIDKDTVIERRMAEIQRLKERLKGVSAETREAARTTRSPVIAKPGVVANRVRAAAANADEKRGLALPEPRNAEVIAEEVMPKPARVIGELRVGELADEVRSQAATAADTLLSLDNTSKDDAMREEIADIAAKMIAITGQREGGSSPIRAMISGKPIPGANGRLSLSDRAAKLIHQE
jgi:DNA repair exonuclease SbcCD ATPase subunit